MRDKLLIIVPNLCLGGQERVAVNTLEVMKKDFEVTLLIFDNKNQAYYPNGEVININIPASPSYIKKMFNVFKRAYKVRKIKKKLGIDYSISFGATANIVNVFSKMKDKVLISIRGYRGIGTSVLDKYLYKKCDKIIACSEEMKLKIQKISDAALKKTVCLYNPYDFDKLKGMGEEEVQDVDFSIPTIVSHGRLEQVKNYAGLIRAFAVAKKEMPDLQLLIIGEGTERRNLEEEIKRLKLGTSVKLIGFRENPFKYLARSKIFTLTSNFEGFPNALVEGMIFLPAISVDCKTGPKEILGLESEYGVLIKKQNDNSIAKAIIDLLKDNEKYNKYKQLAQIRALAFSKETYRKNLLGILME